MRPRSRASYSRLHSTISRYTARSPAASSTTWRRYAYWRRSACVASSTASRTLGTPNAAGSTAPRTGCYARSGRRADRSARPGARNPRRDRTKTAGRVGERGILADHVDHRVRRLDTHRTHLTRTDEHATGDDDAWAKGLGRDLRHTVDDLAAARREVVRALAGHDHVAVACVRA